MTYTELVQKIRDYTEVTSTVLTDTIVNGFIENSEFRILRDVDSDNNRRSIINDSDEAVREIAQEELTSRENKKNGGFIDKPMGPGGKKKKRKGKK